MNCFLHYYRQEARCENFLDANTTIFMEKKGWQRVESRTQKTEKIDREN
jgi:hypothetical protein